MQPSISERVSSGPIRCLRRLTLFLLAGLTATGKVIDLLMHVTVQERRTINTASPIDADRIRTLLMKPPPVDCELSDIVVERYGGRG